MSADRYNAIPYLLFPKEQFDRAKTLATALAVLCNNAAPGDWAATTLVPCVAHTTLVPYVAHVAGSAAIGTYSAYGNIYFGADAKFYVVNAFADVPLASFSTPEAAVKYLVLHATECAKKSLQLICSALHRQTQGS